MATTTYGVPVPSCSSRVNTLAKGARKKVMKAQVNETKKNKSFRALFLSAQLIHRP
jgi:hypothetical protein